jgi:hypothetical protein
MSRFRELGITVVLEERPTVEQGKILKLRDGSEMVFDLVVSYRLFVDFWKHYTHETIDSLHRSTAKLIHHINIIAIIYLETHFPHSCTTNPSNCRQSLSERIRMWRRCRNRWAEDGACGEVSKWSAGSKYHFLDPKEEKLQDLQACDLDRGGN